MKVIVAYVPVLHEGYRTFFVKHPEAETIYLLGNSLIEKFRPLVKDIRRLDPSLMKKAIEALGIFKQVEILELADIAKLNSEEFSLIMPDEDVCRDLAVEFLKDKKITFDSVFLRWDKNSAVAPTTMEIDQEVSEKEFDKKMISLAEEEGQKSPDWWRQVGGVIMKEGKVILIGHNPHVPHNQVVYQDGDPRANFNKGVNLEISSAFHVEANLVAQAARQGVSLEGAEIYVTDFPCPPCAKLVAYSGIKKIYYRRGYKLFDGVSILQSQGVKIIWVK